MVIIVIEVQSEDVGCINATFAGFSLAVHKEGGFFNAEKMCQLVGKKLSHLVESETCKKLFKKMIKQYGDRESMEDEQSDESSKDEQSDESSKDEQLDESSKDEHSDESSKDEHSDESSKDEQSDESSEDEQSDESSKDEQSDESSEDEQPVPMYTEKEINELKQKHEIATNRLICEHELEKCNLKRSLEMKMDHEKRKLEIQKENEKYEIEKRKEKEKRKLERLKNEEKRILEVQLQVQQRELEKKERENEEMKNEIEALHEQIENLSSSNERARLALCKRTRLPYLKYRNITTMAEKYGIARLECILAVRMKNKPTQLLYAFRRQFFALVQTLQKKYDEIDEFLCWYVTDNAVQDYNRCKDRIRKMDEETNTSLCIRQNSINLLDNAGGTANEEKNVYAIVCNELDMLGLIKADVEVLKNILKKRSIRSVIERTENVTLARVYLWLEESYRDIMSSHSA